LDLVLELVQDLVLVQDLELQRLSQKHPPTPRYREKIYQKCFDPKLLKEKTDSWYLALHQKKHSRAGLNQN